MMAANIVNRCLRNPVLIYESSSQNIPPNLKSLLSTFNEEKLTDADYLVILAYTLMIETGFIPYQKVTDFKGLKKSPIFDVKFLTTATTLPEDWKDEKGVYSLTFALPTLPNQKICLTAVAGNENVLFTVWMKINGQTPSWCLVVETRKYVLRRQTEFMNHKFLNLKDLSLVFKNTLPIPVRNYLQENGNVEIHDFLTLPLEVKLLICTYLNRQDILRLSETCVALYDLSRSGILSKTLNLSKR